MVRFWGFVTIAALIGLVVSSAWGQGKPATTAVAAGVEVHGAGWGKRGEQ